MSSAAKTTEKDLGIQSKVTTMQTTQSDEAACLPTATAETNAEFDPIKPARMLHLDVLRILATFMVVMIHVAPTTWAYTNTDIMAGNFYDLACRSAVPLFFMISGYLFLSRPTGPSIKKLYRSNILKLVLVYMVWTALYALASLDFSELAAQGWNAVAPQFIESLLNPHYHLWFLPVMIVVYLLIPALYAIANYEEGKYLGYCCGVFLCIAILAAGGKFIPSITNDFPGAFGRGVAWVLGYSGYFLCGYYLSTKKIPRLRIWHAVILLLVVIVVAFVLAQIVSVDGESPQRYLFANFSLPVCFEAILIFILFLKLKPRLASVVSEKTGKRLVALSGTSLVVYLLHPFIVEHLEQWFGLTIYVVTPWVSIPLIALGVLAVCMLIGLVLTRIPFIKKWIV